MPPQIAMIFIDSKYYESDVGIKYYIDGKNVILDHSEKEKEVAKWLGKTFGGEMYMVPRVNIQDGIKTPDYLFNGEKWDLKRTISSSHMAIDYTIKKEKRQAANFIIDITNSPLSNKEIINQIKKIYVSNSRNWVDKIIVKRNNKLIIVVMRKKEVTTTQMRHDHFH